MYKSNTFTLAISKISKLVILIANVTLDNMYC